MKAKETAELLLESLDTVKRQDFKNVLDIFDVAEMLAKHVLALECNSELQTAVTTSTLAAIAQQQRRYLVLLEQIDAADPAARRVLEHSLDLEIARRTQ